MKTLITDVLHGKTIHSAGANERGELVLICTDGHHVRVKWGGGVPVLSGVDVKIAVGPNGGVIPQHGVDSNIDVRGN